MEQWKSLARDERYQVSNLGRVRGAQGNILRSKRDKDGYLLVSIGAHTCKVHRLVAEAFVPNPDNLPEVNHIDFNKHHNFDFNVEWVTRQQNVEHAKGQYYKILGPCGTTYTGRNVTKFAKDHSLDRSSVSKLVRGELKQVRGYTLCQS